MLKPFMMAHLQGIEYPRGIGCGEPRGERRPHNAGAV